VVLLLAACSGTTSTPTATRPTATAPTATATPVPIPLSVYFGAANSSLYALNASDGSVRWTYKTGGDVAVQSVVDGVLYATSRDHNLYAINTRDGSLLWKYATGAVNKLVIADDGVYVNTGTKDNETTDYALDVQTGALLWKKTGSAAGEDLSAYGTTIYITHNTVQAYYGAPTDGFVYAVNASTGASLWQYKTSGETVEAPSVSDNVVYLPALHSVYALNAATGAVLWHTKAGFDNSTPTIGGSVLYVAGLQGGLTALNPANGTVVWTGGCVGYGTYGLDIAGSTLYVMSYTTLCALKAANGAEEWHFDDPKGFNSLSEGVGVVCLTSGDNNLYSFSASTGALLWHFQGLPEVMMASVSGNNVFAAATQNTNPGAVPPPNNGVLYAFNATSGAQQWKYQADSPIGGGFVVA
jgi:outer membrane protein assembly factor BamB